MGTNLVAGHLYEHKNGTYYIILNLKDENGKRKPKWIPTNLKIKGNRKRAEEMLLQARMEYGEKQNVLREAAKESTVEEIVKEQSTKKNTCSISQNILFADYMETWLQIIRPSIRIATYSSYCHAVRGKIAPYFKETGIKLVDLKPIDIQNFYAESMKTVTASTVIKYHANIHRALKYAVRINLIPVSPADNVDRPRKEPFIPSFYDRDEINQLFERTKGTKLEFGVLMGAFYGLRRGEIVGLKWDAIDFEANTISIQHTVKRISIDGKRQTIKENNVKGKSSFRTLPLVPQYRDKLLQMKQEQEANRRLCGKSYNKENLEYIYVNEMGDLINPDYLTKQFPEFLVKNGMRRIRFHDLRHSCASLLLANNVNLKQIQEWLGHSDFSTTANIYAHLDYNSKVSSAYAMMVGLGMDENEETTAQPEETKEDGEKENRQSKSA